MKALALEHLHSNPLGVYGDVLADRGVDVDRVLLDRGHPLRDWRAYDFLVVMGGGMSAYDDQVYPWLVDEKRTIREAVLAGVPFFGVCLGAQLLASALGASVYRGPAPELGVIPLYLSEAARRDPVFRGLPSDLEVFQWHCDTFALPDGATRLAGSPRYENQAFRYGDVAYAIQCHLETTVEDVQDWFAAWPSLGETFEERYGQGALAAFLDEYAASVPHLRATARQVFRRWLESALANGRRASKQSDEQSLECSGNGLIGRARERAQLHALVADARDGRGGALTIAAAGGAGKTALLDVIEREATGIRVLRAAGVETVAERPLAGIDALCRPLLDLLPELAEGESAALAAALELGGDDDSPDDRFAVYAGAASLLRAGARRQPLLVLVDDAHLLDEPSREAVEFIASQVDGSSIAIVVATEDRPRSGSALLELPPLDRPAALTLLDRCYDSIANTVLGDIVDAAAGNPLALLEMANGDDGAAFGRGARRGHSCGLRLCRAGVSRADLGTATGGAPGARGRCPRQRRAGHGCRRRTRGARVRRANVRAGCGRRAGRALRERRRVSARARPRDSDVQRVTFRASRGARRTGTAGPRSRRAGLACGARGPGT